jgi:putative flippase GtrA
VDSVLRLYPRFRELIHNAAKFLVVGGAAFLVTELVANILHFDAGLGPLTATVLANVVATVVSYLGNRFWAFRHREGSPIARETTLFVVLNVIGTLIQLASTGFTYYALGLTGRLPYNVALVIGIGLGTLFRFWSYRKWVWRESSEVPPTEHEPLEPAGAGGPASPAGAASGESR